MSYSRKELTLQYKYADISDEVKYTKKKKKKSIKKANHKHKYEPCLFNLGHSFGYNDLHLYPGAYCPICGKIEDIRFINIYSNTDGLPVFSISVFDKFVPIERDMIDE